MAMAGRGHGGRDTGRRRSVWAMSCRIAADGACRRSGRSPIAFWLVFFAMPCGMAVLYLLRARAHADGGLVGRPAPLRGPRAELAIAAQYGAVLRPTPLAAHNRRSVATGCAGRCSRAAVCPPGRANSTAGDRSGSGRYPQGRSGRASICCPVRLGADWCAQARPDAGRCKPVRTSVNRPD